jgi:hypothetical protein
VARRKKGTMIVLSRTCSLNPRSFTLSKQSAYRLVIVSASPSLDFLLGHSTDWEENNDKEGQATFNFAGVSFHYGHYCVDDTTILLENL